MTDLPKGYSIQTKNFKKVIVGEKIGKGGEGQVYRVNYDGKPKALKWYLEERLKNPDKFYENLENNIKKGKPTKAFLWPEDLVGSGQAGEPFGYIMDLRPPEYKDFSKFILEQETFAGVTPMVNAALNIIAGFRALHNRGYSYQDLNDGNFSINPQNGDVLICDNDNVSEHGKNFGILGKDRYMAPEIVAKRTMPNSLTDRFSLSVVLFLLWTTNHPLEGKNSYPPCMDAANEIRIYGTNPVFIFDPSDDSNRPVPGLNRGAIIRWPLLPEYLRKEFIKAFSKELMNEPAKRIIDQEWLRLFIRMRGEVYKCPSCGLVYFANPEVKNPCPECKKIAPFPFYIKTRRYNLPVHQRTKLYACHTEKDSEDFETLTGEVAVKDGGFGLKNVSGRNWMVTEGRNTSNLAPGASVMLKKNMLINFGADSAEIK
jgi:DNA-binding helix-hairpin-helix protein with protein kinase domain